MTNKNKQKIRQMVQLSILTALVLLLAFTPIGYLRIGALTITFLPVPVVIGAVLMGPRAGAFLGCVFGLTSFAQCFGIDPFGTTLMTINIFYTFLMTVVTRTLMGLLSGYLYRGMQAVLRRMKPLYADKLEPIACAVACASAPLFNTLLFMSTMYFCFRNETIVVDAFGTLPFFAFVFGSVGINAVCELLASLIIGTAICTALRHSGVLKRA